MIIICPMCSNQILWSIAVSGDRLEVWQILGRSRAINCHAQFDLTSGKRAERRRGHQGTVYALELSPNCSNRHSDLPQSDTMTLGAARRPTELFMSSQCNLMPCWYNIMLLNTTKIQTYYKQLLWISHFNVSVLCVPMTADKSVD